MILSKQLAVLVLNEGLKSGADFAEIFVQDEFDHSISLSHKRVDSVVSKEIYGAGIRLIKGKDKVVYGYTSDLSKASLLKLASDLSSSFKGEREITVTQLKLVSNPKKHQPVKPHSSLTDEEKIAYLKKGEQAAYAVSPLIVNVSVSVGEWDEKVEIYNSKGKIVLDNRTRTRLFFNSVAAKDGQFQMDYEGPGGSEGLELFDRVDPAETGKLTAETAVKLLSAPECPSGKMTVIIGNAFGGVIFHEACGHPLEATAISHNSSAFCGKLNKKIASDVVSAIDDGTIDHGWGSSNFDDEGEKTTKNLLIKDGVLVNYMVDNYDGKRIGLPTSGCCRRQSYKFLPTTRMTNTYICAGKSTPEEIIKATKYGLYCVSFKGGSVDPTTDKFNFTASKAYIIKNGKIDHLVRDASLVGYGYEVLMNIDMVADDVARGQGNCGAASGMCPVDVGQPTIRVQNITVGGRGGNL